MLSLNRCKKVLRTPRFTLAAAAVLLFAPLALHATPITYNLTLTETDGNGSTYSGTGQVTLDVAGAVQNYFDYTTSTGLTALTFSIDGQSFSLADLPKPEYTVFEFSDVANGGVWDITFAETNANNYRLVSTSQYIFYTPVNNPVSPGYTGVFTASAAPPHPANAVAPEPSSIALFGTGLLTCIGTLRRRIRPC